MPMSDVAPALIYTEHGNGTTKHAKAPPPSTPIITTATGTAGAATTNMTNSSKTDVIAGGAAAAAAAQLGTMLAPATSLSLSSMQGQKWQQVFDLDKMIKQLRSAEKTHLRGGAGKASGGAADAKQLPHVVQVQRLNAADMAYYDMVPKLAARDLVVCNSCNSSFTKAGFNNHVALQHPSIWDAVPNKLNSSSEASRSLTAAGMAENSQDGLRDPAELLGSPTDTLSATMSSCSNGSSSSIATAANSSSTNNTHVSSSSASASSSSSSRHKSSSKSSSSSKTSSSTGRSRSKSSKNRHHSDVHHKVGSKKSSAIAATAPPAAAAAAAAVVAASAPAAVKDEIVQPAITVFSSSSNSSCSMPPTPTLAAVAASNGNELGINYSPANMLDEPQPNKKKLKGSAASSALESASHHRSKTAKEKQVTPIYEQHQQLTELDQAVSSITGHVELEAQVQQQQQQQQQQRQHQVDLSAVTEEPLPMHNTSDDNSISLTLDDMLDSKFINEILNTAESDIPFDESALDTSQSQPQQPQQLQLQQQQLSADQQVQATKRMRYDDATINSDAAEYATALYQQQQQQQVYSEEQQHGGEQTQLTAIDAMQLQQLIYQQQQMLEQADQQQQQQQQQQHQHLKQELNEEAAAQFSVYNVPSLTDDAEAEVNGAGTDEHMILPSIIYEITDNNQVSVLDQQSQQQVIAEFLTQAGYDNVDVNVNVLQASAAAAAAAAAADTNGGMGVANYFNDELCDFDFTKLETVSAEANHTKTVKLENQPQPLQPANTTSTTYSSYESVHQTQPHRQLANAKYHEDSTYFNMTLYAGPPRPLAMNTFGLVKLPNGMGATLRKNLLTTRKANNSLLSLNGSSGVVGTLARTPPPLPTVNCNGNAAQLLLPRNAAQGKTIYAQKCSIIAQERVRCNKRTLPSRSNGSSSCVSMTVKRLNELLSGKVKPSADRERTELNESGEQQQQQLQEENKRMHSFYEKRRKLLAAGHQRQSHNGSNIGGGSNIRPFMRQRPMHLPLQLHAIGGGGSVGNINAIGSPSPQQQLLKKQLLRTLSDSSNIQAVAGGVGVSGTGGGGGGSGSNNPWKSNSSTPGSNSAGSDLMRVFV